MPIKDRLIAVTVAIVWGVNFVAIHLSLEQFPPFLLVAMRFGLIAIPTVLWVRPPRVPMRWVLGYGAGFGVAQFAFLYLAMAAGMPAGIASLVLQSSAPFTMILAVLLVRERIGRRAVLGVTAAVLGLAGIAISRAGDQATGVLPVVLTLLGGLGWAFGNLANRKAATTEPFRLVLWMSVVVPVPMLALSLLVEGPSRIAASFDGITSRQGVVALLALLFTVVVASIGGSGLWTVLMSRHPSSTVAPFSMLVPVVGIATSWFTLREAVPLRELLLGVVVIGGVLVAATQSRVPRSTSAVAIAATPSPRPVSPRPSVVVPATETGASSAPESTASASDLRAASLG